jgi:hypothetical protein
LRTLFEVFLCVLFYLALEPIARRYWPQSLISWSRLVTGKVSDPLVCRDVLAGVTLFAGWLLLYIAALHLVGYTKLETGDELALLHGGSYYASLYLNELKMALVNSLLCLFLTLVIRLCVKNWLLVSACWIVPIMCIVTLTDGTIVDYLGSGFLLVPVLILLPRGGFLSLAACFAWGPMLYRVPFTADVSAWYFGGTKYAALVLIAPVAYTTYVCVKQYLSVTQPNNDASP